MKARICLKYFVSDCLWKQFRASNSSQFSLSLICLTVFVTLTPLAQFLLKLEQPICKKALKFVLLTTFLMFSLRFKVSIDSFPSLV